MKKSWGVWLAAFALLSLLGRASVAQGAAPVEPLIAPGEMLTVDQLRPGMKGYGLSVFEGTKIERFNVTVLGVLKKVDFDGDMVLIRIDDGYPVTSRSGVSQGMSGSPIYVDGKLVGALAFAWPFAKDPVAGVTPINQMLNNYRPGSAPSPSHVKAGDLQPVGGPLRIEGKLFARATVVPDREMAPAGGSALYLAPVATPVMLSGMGRAGQDILRQRLGRFSAVVAPGPGKMDLPPGERPKLEPGSAVGVQLLSGDIDATAIGTVTYVKGDHVLAFGHPMFGLGTISMPMSTAYVHGIISSQEVSFKMGSPVETVGAVMQDRNWSIGGRTGEKARLVDAEFEVRDRDRSLERKYRVSAAVHKDLTSSLLYGALTNAVNSVSPLNSGTSRGVTEVWAKGMPVIRRENLFSVGERKSALEQLFGDPFAGMPLVELLQILDTLENNSFGSVPVEKIRVAVDVEEKRRSAVIERAYADRKRVKPGEKIKIGVVIQPVNGAKEQREFEVEIPKNIPGGRLQIGVAGGSAAERVRQFMQIMRPPAKTLEQQLSLIAGREKNDDLTIEIAQPVAGVAVSGRELPNLPNVVVEVLTGANPSGIRMIRSHSRQTHEMPWVLSGVQLLSLLVESDEKDKTGPSFGAAQIGAPGIGSLLDLFRFGFGGADLGGDLGGDFGEGEGVQGELEDAEAEALLGRNPLALAAKTRRAPEKQLPTEPRVPSFEELQRLLEDDSDATAATETSAPNLRRKGLGRAPGVWSLRTAKDFQGGKLDGILVSSRGELAVAPQAKTLLSSPERFYWAQTTDPSGNVYAGGWLDGSIVRLDAEGKLHRFFEGAGEIAISALTSDSSGTVYAAAEPSGTIYAIAQDGQARSLCTLPNERVWVLRRVGDTLFAGTGSEGRLYRISPEGKPELVFTAPDRHVFALADDGKGALYLGTYPRGKVFRYREGKVEPVYELTNATVSALACDAKGGLYIGTSPRAQVIRLSPTGDATTLFQSKEKHIFSLLVEPDGSVVAGVGGQAKVYRIAPDRTVSTLWEPQSAYVLSLSRDAAGKLYATTAGPTQIVCLDGSTGAAGTYVSRVLPAGNLAKWGAVRWTGAAAGVEIQTRTGNTAYPDSTWSEWSPAYKQAAGEQIASPPGHYLQYRVVLKGKEGAPAPFVRSLDLFYRARNRAPEVTVKGPGAGEVLAGGRGIRWAARDPDRDRLTYDVFYARENSDVWVKIGSRGAGNAEDDEVEDDAETRLPAAPAVGRAPIGATTRMARTAKPAAGSARTAVSRRAVRTGTPAPRPVQVGAQAGGVAGGAGAEGVQVTLNAAEAAEVEAEESGGGASLSWNTRKVPDGRYRIKVVASDASSSPDEPATGEAVSELVQVDNSGPKLKIGSGSRTAQAPPAEISATDAGTYVASAEYRTAGGEWVAAGAADGIFDSANEAIRIDAARLKPGRQLLEVRVRDAAANETILRVPYFLAKK